MNNAKYMPTDCFSKTDPTLKKAPIGQCFFQHSECKTLSAVAWVDKSIVRLLNSNPEMGESLGSCERGDRNYPGSLRKHTRPEVIKEYNLNMGGVDRA